MIPEGWQQLDLSRVCNKPISYGIVQTGPNVKDGIPCVRVNDLSEREIRVDRMIKTSSEISESYKKTILEQDEIIFALRGDVGLARIVDGPLVNINITRGLARISPNQQLVHPHYLLWELRSPTLRADLLRRVGGSALQEISLSELRKVKTLVPPIREQVKIAETLSTCDQAIETTEKLIENSKAQKKALMQQLLTGKKRLPGFNNDWQQLRFTQIFERITDKNHSGNDNVLTISGKRGLVNQREFFNKRVASANLDSYTLLRRGDFAYNKSYSTGYPYGAIKPLERYDAGVVSSLYLCFRFTGDTVHCHDYFRHYFEGGFFDREIYAIAQEGARNHGLLNVSSKGFFARQLLTPSPKEQIAIAAVINTAEANQNNLENQLTVLQRQKRALMQQLLTGKRRVKVAA